MTAYERPKANTMNIYGTFNVKNIGEIKFGNIDTITDVAKENPCANVEICDHLCLPKGVTEYVCKCSLGFSLGADGRTCNTAKTIGRVLVADMAQGTLFHVDPSSGKIAAVLSIFPENFGNVAFHIFRQKGYFYYTPFLTSQTEIMQYEVSSKTQSVLYQTSDIITDLIADKWEGVLYYSDITGSIHELTINPPHTEIIVSDHNSSINRIYLDTATKHLIYSDCSTNSIIELDLISKTKIKIQYFDGCISAMALLKKQKIVFYAIGNQIYKAKMKELTTVNFYEAKEIITDLLIDGGFLYVLNSNSLYKLNMSTGSKVGVTSPVFTNGRRIIIAKTSVIEDKFGIDMDLDIKLLSVGCFLYPAEDMLHIVQFMFISFGMRLMLRL